MQLFPSYIVRVGVSFLTPLLIAACSSAGDGGTQPGSITLALASNSASIQQGSSAAVVGTLPRSGGFTGTVNLSVLGEPSGVTGVVSNIATNGTVTTATITINVDLGATVGGPTILTVHGTGTGVDEALATFALTITAAPVPAYTLTLSGSVLSIPQRAATRTP